jgi:5-methylthioadenosine/S-adenosylhomocysteine deaminase
MTTTCIRDAAWIVAWDRGTERHVYLRDADLVFVDDRIAHVGPRFEGLVDNEIDGRSLLVMPGLVDIHTHLGNAPARKGMFEEAGNPHLLGSSWYEVMVLLHADDAGRKAATQYALCELALSGVTSVMDWSAPYDGWLDDLGDSGLRGWVAPGFESASVDVLRGREIVYDWDEAAGHRGLDAALALIDEAHRHPSGRLAGVVAPHGLEMCSEELLRDSVAAARDKGWPFQVHAGESIREFHELTRRHGCSGVQWANTIGLLGPTSAIGHGLFLDHHPDVQWPTRRDVGLLADTGTTIAHSPTVFARLGQAVHTLGDYLQAGINVGMGTDVLPHNMLEEMRTAIVLGRVVSKADSGTPTDPSLDVFSLGVDEVFTAATVGSARFLGREDIGRLAPGAKADLVLVKLDHPMMLPVWDPLRSLIYSAAERAVRDVYIDGRAVVRDGRMLAFDIADAGARVQSSQRRIAEAVADRDDAGRSAEQLSPLAFTQARGISGLPT